MAEWLTAHINEWSFFKNWPNGSYWSEGDGLYIKTGPKGLDPPHG